jgi:hypothetical protein
MNADIFRISQPGGGSSSSTCSGVDGHSHSPAADEVHRAHQAAGAADRHHDFTVS